MSHADGMNTSRLPAFPASRQSRAVAALAAAGVAWGTSVPLSKAALAWLPPAWLVTVRFALAAAVLLAVVDRTALRRALRWPVLAWGAVGYGGSVLLQNAGLAATSVTHAALLIGTGPVLVAVIAAAWHHNVARPVAWAGFTVSLGGVALVASGGGGGASGGGDALVLVSVLLSSAVTVAQARLLRGQDPVAVTAVLFVGAAVAALPAAALTGGLPSAPPPGGAGLVAVLAVLGLTVIGTVVPFTLFAYGQRTAPAEVAGAFLNLEPLVGALAGVVAFGDPAGPRLLAGGAAIIGGIGLSSLPSLRDRRGQARSGSRSATESRMTGAPGSPVAAGTASRSVRRASPDSTPATRPAPARKPDSMSAGVSPTTARLDTARPPSRSSAVSGRSGHGRPRPASAGASTRSTSGAQPRAAMITSRVSGEKPVVRHTFVPAARQAANSSSDPGIGAISSAATAPA